MYTLCYGFYKHVFRKDEFFILILGLDNAGKTTFLEQTKATFNQNYRMMNPTKITSTVGLNIGKIDIGTDRLNFWDLGGQTELQALWDKYYSESHGIIYVVDSSDMDRLRESWRAFDAMLSSDHIEGMPLILVCNKQDLDGCMSVTDVKTVFHESVEKLGRRDCTVLPVSALNGTNVAEAIDWMHSRVKRNIGVRPPHDNI